MPRHHHDIRHPRGGFGAATRHYQLNARMPNLAQVDYFFIVDDGRHFATIHENFRRTPPRHPTPATPSSAEHTEEEHDHESTSDTHEDNLSRASTEAQQRALDQIQANKRPLPGYDRFIGFYTQVEESVWRDTEVRLQKKEKVLAKIVRLCGDRIFNKMCAKFHLPEEIQTEIRRFLGNCWMQWDVNLHGCITAPRACNICAGRAVHARRAEIKDLQLAKATVQDSNFLRRLDEGVKRAASQGMWHSRVEFEFQNSSSLVCDEVRHNYDGLLMVSRRKRAIRNFIASQLRTYGFTLQSMSVTLNRQSFVIVCWNEGGGSEDHTDNDSNLTSTSGPGGNPTRNRRHHLPSRTSTTQAGASDLELAQRYLRRFRRGGHASPPPVEASSSVHSSVTSSDPNPPEPEPPPSDDDDPGTNNLQSTHG